MGCLCQNVLIFMISEFYSSENCCYGYQMQINNQFMPILFNFIVFSNTQNFLYFSEHGVRMVITQSGRKK